MKANTFRTMGAAAVLLGGMGGASLAQAFTVNGALGGAVNSEDVYRLACPALTVTVKANVTDLGVGPEKLSVMLIRPLATSPEKVKVDFREAPDGATSPFASDVPGAQDAFFVAISKDATNVVSYRSVMECRDINGIDISNVAPVLVQSQ